MAGRKTIKRGTGQRAIEAKDFRLADEVNYIQCRAAKHDGRVVTVGPLILFSTDTGDAWLLDPPITSRPAWRRMVIPNRSTLAKPILISRLTGRASTASKATRSSTSRATPAESSLSSATLPAALLDWADLKTSNIFG